MFKANIKDTRTTSLTPFCFLYCLQISHLFLVFSIATLSRYLLRHKEGKNTKQKQIHVFLTHSCGMAVPKSFHTFQKAHAME